MNTRCCFLPWLLLLALAVTPPLLAEDSPPLLGQDAPLFSGQDQDGTTWKLSDHIGKQPVFLYFYPRDDSAGCTAEACSLRDNMYNLKQAGVEVVGVSFDSKDSHKNFAFKYGLDYPLLADTSGSIADAYGARKGEHQRARSLKFSADEIKDLTGMINHWKGKSNELSAFLWKSLSRSEKSSLKNYAPSGPASQQAREVVLKCLNKIIGGPSIYKEDRFKGVSLRAETMELAKQKAKGRDSALLNRLLLEDAYPRELSREQRIDRRVSFLIGLDGKIIHVTESPDPAEHVKELLAALAKLKS